VSHEEPAPEPDPETQSSGSGLAAEKAKRLDKIAALRDAGTNPYPYRFDRTHTLEELRS
jgi:lysyl-tRNA synthetase, class II